MKSRIEQLGEKKLAGKRIRMSLRENKTRALWQHFMQRRKEIPNITATELFSIEVYDNTSFFNNFNPGAEFEKWAAVAVSDFEGLPSDVEPFILPAGLYAVFLHRGPAAEGGRTYRHIFETWLPHSGFELDDRPHFALMGEKYKNDDPDSEEEIWIPIRNKDHTTN